MKCFSFIKTKHAYFSISALTRINRFERAISIRLYNVTKFQFVLRFPINIDLYNNEPYCSQDYAILQNELWQSRGWFVRDYIDTEKKLFIIYTIPYALSSDRFLRNHNFIAAQQSAFVDLKTYQLLSWICKDANSSAMAQSLSGLSQARHLHWSFEAKVRFYSFSNASRHVEDYAYKQLFFELLLTLFYA